jgi:flagellin-specific chaperone FliS
MLARKSPQETYRRVDFDARVAGADAPELVALCYEQLVSAIGSAIFANERGDNALKSQSLTRALSAVTALQLGIRGDDGVAGALRTFYDAARRALLENVTAFTPERLHSLRRDVAEVAEAVTGSARQLA